MFYKLSSLKKVTIGSGCTSISPTAFTGANSIEEIIVEEDNKKYTSVDGVLYNNDKTTLVLYPRVDEAILQFRMQ